MTSDERSEETRWAVLLDAGGVILDETEHERVNAESVSRAIAEVVPGYAVPDYHRDAAETVARFVPRVYPAIVYKRVSADAFERVWKAHLESFRRAGPALRLMPGIREVIEDLAPDFALALAGQYRGEVTDLLEEHGLLSRFACPLHQGHYEITKPDPRFFERIAANVGVEPARCIVVGDRIDKDVIPAHQLGMKAVRIRVGLHRDQMPRLPEEEPDVDLPDVTGLADAIRELAADRE